MYSLHSDFPNVFHGQELYLTDEQAQIYKIMTRGYSELPNGYYRSISAIPVYKNYYFDVKWNGNLSGIKWHVIVNKM
jgi:hypothetical protein